MMIYRHCWQLYFFYIWSDYGDEIVVDKGIKLTKWGPSGRVSQRLSMKERGTKVLKQKKSKKKELAAALAAKKQQKPKSLYSRESQAQLTLQAMAHIDEPDTKAGYHTILSGSEPIHFVDFSNDYKKCLKLARENLEKNEKLSLLEKQENEWINDLKGIRGKPLSEKLIQLKVHEIEN